MQKHVQPRPLARAGAGAVDDGIAGPEFVPVVELFERGGDEGGGKNGLSVEAEGYGLYYSVLSARLRGGSCFGLGGWS